jgi:translation initiation factor IF-2
LGKHLKLNIKNTQLAEAFKIKKKEPAEAAPAVAPKTETSAPAPEGEPKKKLTRLREDAAISSALKQAEKTLAARDKEKEVEAPKKKRARIIQGPEEAAREKEEAAAQAAMQEAAKAEEPATEPIKSDPETQDLSSAAEKSEAPKTAETKPPAPKATPEAHAPLPQSTIVRREPPKELRLPKKKEEARFDSRDRQGLRDVDNEAWRKRRAHKPRKFVQEEVIRPKELSIHLPITIKDLAQEMKLKSSQLIAKLFMKGITLTLNDYLDDETVVQLLGHDFGCEIQIDVTEQARIRITDQTIRQEVEATSPDLLVLRPPVVTFMGHVDHGKTSLIDSIRKSNRVAGEAGAITQHIGAFKVKTNAGDVAILDTPGHEAFSEMRSRGANVTDIVILVIAGDEGARTQTEEAIRQAREANVPILVALNKCDKPTFDAQKVYRDLADRDLLPESWGGTTITVNCSAATGQGVTELLEMIALQAEILELRANPAARARGTVLESEMHKGLGAVATVLVQNGT